MIAIRLIGRDAGEPADFSPLAFSVGMDNGTLRRPTQEEIIKFNLPDPGTRLVGSGPEQFPAGYEARRDEEDVGYDVFHESIPGQRINGGLFRNLAAARSFAVQHRDMLLAAQEKFISEDDKRRSDIPIPADWRTMKPTDQRLLAQEFVPEAKSKSDVEAAITEELERRHGPPTAAELNSPPPIPASTT